MYMLGACLHLPVSRQVWGTEEGFSSQADILSIADAICSFILAFLAMFLDSSSAISSSRNV